MKADIQATTQKEIQTLIKKCHMCGEIIEGSQEPQKCPHCNKNFLPLNYFDKVHEIQNPNDYKGLFEMCQNLHPDDLIKGLLVLW